MPRFLPPLLILTLGLLAYSDSFHGPFIFDDIISLRDNPQIRGLLAAHPPGVLPDAISARPVLILTFKLNYLLGKLNVESYHVVNLIIHLAVGLLLYGIVRRTIHNPALATAIAAIWIVHPLNTEAVTYIVQRSESLAALFYLAVIYCLIRRADGGGVAWSIAAVICCALGMGTKEVLVTAPLIALLFDRTFLAGSFAAALRRRRWLYAGLAATWIIGALVVFGERQSPTIGFHIGISPLEYARTELNVIAHYFLLSVWPRRLALDYYDWPVARRWTDVGWGGWLVVVLIIAVIVALWKKPRLGFLGAWVLVILAPSSSFVPLPSEIAAERRMYLPLMAIIALMVVGGWAMLRRTRPGRIFAVAAVCAVVCILGTLTFQRNHLYASAIDIMADAVAARPNNPRALYDYGNALSDAGYAQPEGSPAAVAYATAAADAFARSIHARPDNDLAWDHLGQSLLETKNWTAAFDFFTDAITAHPPFAAEAYLQRGKLRAQHGDLANAVTDFRSSIALRPNDPAAHYFLAVALELTHDLAGAKTEYQRTLDISPQFKDARARLGRLRASGK
jgi:hypothetical protein